MTITDSDRILAAGIPITVDGEERRLRYSFRALKVLEDHFGSLGAAVDAIARVLNDGMNGERIIVDLAVLVAAGLDDDPDTILDRLAGSDSWMIVRDAAVACTDAWIEAFPQAVTVEPGKAGEPAETASTGGTSTTSPPSPADAQMATSGR